MAEREDIVVSPLVEVLIDKLASDVRLVCFGSDWNVQPELNELSDTLKSIQAMLGCLEMMQTRDPLVKLYLKKLRDLAFDVDVVLDEFIYEVHHQNNRGKSWQVCKYISFSLNANQVLQQHEIAPLINGLKEKLLQIENNLKPSYSIGSLLEMEGRLKSIQLPQDDTRQKSGSLIDESHVVSREEDVKIIKNMLLSSTDQYNNQSQRDVPVIAIVGMGGIGKTTIAQLVYNDPDVENHFDLKAWTCVSDDFHIARLTGEILESATWEPCNLKNLEPLQAKLKKEIRGKKLLLVLDDVWNEKRNSWDALIVPIKFVEKGSRILITTRSSTVSSIMNPIYRHDLQTLSDENCWSLIKARVSLDETSISFPKFEAIGRKIAKKCKGLPLAANTIGGLLCTRLHENEWEDILQNNHWSNILPALSVSYHYLPPHLKQCFAYCSLFRKDYKFDKRMLIRLWMAEGFIQSKQVEIIEDIGSQYFDDLLARSFFQKCPKDDGPISLEDLVHVSYDLDEKSRFVMHDLIHDLAESVSGKQYVRIDKSLQKGSIAISKEARGVSIFTRETIDKEVFRSRQCLYTCLSSSRSFGNDQVLGVLLEELRWLRVLDLRNNGIKILPDSIGELKHLRYLDLSENPNIEMLPESICKLYNLQTLNLKGCSKFRTLPMGMGNLVNLQHLMIESSPIPYRLCIISGNWCLDDIPRGIGRLTCVKTFPFFNVGPTDGCRIGELKELQHLHGKLVISKLQNVVNAEDAKEANLKNKRKLGGLELRWTGRRRYEDLDWDINILGGLQPHSELMSLGIYSYCGSRFPNWMMIDLMDFNKLVSVTLHGCNRCKILPPLGKLQSLKFLILSNFYNVKELGHEFYGESEKSFQSLMYLKLSCMNNLKKWFTAKEGDFPCLSFLEILNCGKLRELPAFLPAIQVLRLVRCDNEILNEVHRYTSLIGLDIYSFSNLTTLPPSMLAPLAESDAHERLESYVYQKLTDLEIANCPCFTSFPEELLNNFTSLESIRMIDCPSLTSMPRELDKLHSLTICDCPSLISMPRGLHNLTSLRSLRIEHDCEQVLSFFEEKNNLPPRLTWLCISDCNNVKNLPKGLHLSSLKELYIYNCPKLKRLPKEGFPTSLHVLHLKGIKGNLWRRCKEGNEDWLKIAHIPRRKISKRTIEWRYWL